jgi:hypothetical protein
MWYSVAPIYSARAATYTVSSLVRVTPTRATFGQPSFLANSTQIMPVKIGLEILRNDIAPPWP